MTPTIIANRNNAPGVEVRCGSFPALFPARLAPGSSHWCIARDGDSAARELFHRHYSRYVYRDGRQPKKIIGPGEYMLLITPDERAVFAWRKFVDASGQRGVNCCIFRNEGGGESSALIRDAMALAWARWPGERLYTYVNPHKIRSTNPGYCFIKAGWRKCGTTKKRKLIVLECLAESLSSPTHTTEAA